jgi:hypothetical protein
VQGEVLPGGAVDRPTERSSFLGDRGAKILWGKPPIFTKKKKGAKKKEKEACGS